MTDHQENQFSKLKDRIYNSFQNLTALLPFLPRQQSLSGGGSPEVNDSQPTELHGIIIGVADDPFHGQNLTILGARELAPDKGVDADDDDMPSISGESTRLSSLRISETAHSFSYSFTDRGSTSTSTSIHINYSLLDHRVSPELLCLFPETLESSPSTSSLSITPTTNCTLDSPTPYRPKQITIKNCPRISSGNVFGRQELAKHVVGFTVAFSPGVMILHHSSPKTMTWSMSVTVILLLSVGVAALWNSNLVQDEYPVCAHRIQMLGFALALAAFWGLISCFLWNTYAIVVPIACWAVSGVILALKAYKFKDPRHDI